MTEEPSRESETTYYILVEMGQHVPQDNGFYATFKHKELTNGVESLKNAIAVAFNNLTAYMERRMGSGVSSQEG